MKNRRCNYKRSNRCTGIVLIVCGMLALMILVLPPICWLVGAALALIAIGLILLRKK